METTFIKDADETVKSPPAKARVEIEFKNETPAAARTFNKITGDWKQANAESNPAKSFEDNILSSMADALIVFDADAAIERVNQAAVDLTGYAEEELIGLSGEILFEDKSLFGDLAGNRLRSKSFGGETEACWLKKDGASFPVSLSVSNIFDADSGADKIVCFARDATERKRLEAEFRVISETMHGVASTSNLEELLALIHESIGKILYAENCFVALYDPKTALLSMQFFVDKYDEAPPPLRVGKGLTAYVFRKGRSMLMTSEVVAQLIEQGEVEAVGTDSPIWLGVPLRTPTGIIGVLVVQHYEDKNAYNQQDLEFLTSVGDQIALAIERKRAEKQLELFNEKLQQSNRELQDFAYVASHDLQEPLRKVQAFADRLSTKYADALEGAGLDYLERMRNAAERMQKLIQDLLTFSRVTTKTQPFVAVNLKKVTGEVLSDLEVSIEQAGATIEVGDLPTLEADPLQMRQLMQNLVGNALKFRRADAAPLVKIYARPAGNDGGAKEDSYRIFVEDNGIGFDEKYLDRIFTVFQRLHGRAEYEGSGVGLAVCRKIAERHGGGITAKSAPGEGATFIVTLPLKQKNREEVN